VKYQDSYPSPRDKTRRGRKNPAKRLGAREIVQRVAWLSLPAVSWAGLPPESDYEEHGGYRSSRSIIADRLSRLSPGIYALELEYDGASPDVDTPAEKIPELVNPKVVGVVRGPAEACRRRCCVAFAV